MPSAAPVAGDDEGVRELLTAYSRVSVVTGERTVDLALPSVLPLSDVLPQVMRYVVPDHDGDSPTAWTLARLGGSALSLSQTLADVGVLDGDVLELRPATEEVRPAQVEDVRDAVEDSVDAAGGVWVTLTTGSFAVLAGSSTLGLLGALALFRAWHGGLDGWEGVDGPTAALVAVAGLLLSTWWADRHARPMDAQVAAVAAMVWGATLGEGLGGAADAQAAVRLLLAVVGLAAVGGLCRVLTPATTGHAAAAAVLLAAGTAYSVAWMAGLAPQQAVRVLPVLALLAVGVLPRVSLSVGGLTSADYRVRHVGRLDLSALRARYRASNALLLGGLTGISLAVLWGGTTLQGMPDAWDQTLAASLAAAAAMRSRLFSRIQHMLPLRVATVALAAVIAAEFSLQHTGLLPWLPAALAGLLVLGVGLASVPLTEITRARVKRTLNIVEFLVIVDLLVIMCGALGLYGQIGGMFG